MGLVLQSNALPSGSATQGRDKGMPNNYWRTPERVLAPAYDLQRHDREAAGIPVIGDAECFGLDPFATRTGVPSHVRAAHYLREDRRKPMGGGAFAQPWKPLAGDALAWANPPYGRDLLGPSMRLQMEQAATGVWLVNLVPASTDVGWFHECWQTAAQVCFWKGRIKFEDPTRKRKEKNSPLFASALFHWPGDVRCDMRMELFHEVYSEHGIVVPCGELSAREAGRLVS